MVKSPRLNVSCARLTSVAFLTGLGLLGGSTAHAIFSASRLVSGLNQPVYATAAPGDPTGISIVERAGTGSTVGDIVRYDTATGSRSTFLNIPGSLVQDGGLLGLTFHPDYATNGLFYVTSLVGSNNRLEEYRIPIVNGVPNGTPAKTRTLLSYDNLRTQHTIDWVGFQPNMIGAARNELYVTMGDGGIQANETGFANRGQDPTTVFGKVLRLDVNPPAPHAYPSDPNKNFAIPAGNPFTTDTTGKLKEILATGFRNPWRASFDRLTGDMYLGDVGFNTKEEINFLKNDATFASGKDFGWASREGTLPNPVSAFAGPQATSINPVYELNHPVFNSITGGYLYRGAIEELYGKYIFGDFVSGKIFALTFDTGTDPAAFNGATAGVSGVQDITTLINALLIFNGGAGPVTGLVSFGEDAQRNLLILSIGTGNIYNPALGTGSVYVLRAIPEPASALVLGGLVATLGCRRRR